MQSSDSATAHDPLRDVMGAIMRAPEFHGASRRYVADVIAWRKRLGLFNRVGTNIAFHIINYALYFHLANRAGTVEHGATYSNILDACEKRDLCGARALRTTLVLLGVMGQLSPQRSPTDGRVQVYVPTEKLIAEARDIYGYSMSVLDALVPGFGFERKMLSDPHFIAHIVSRIGPAIVEDNVLITEYFPALHDIIVKAGGLPTSISLAHAQMNGLAFPSTHQIARDFKLSPSQVRSVFGSLADCGLITRSQSGDVTNAEKLAEAHQGLIAREIALHAVYALDLEQHLCG